MADTTIVGKEFGRLKILSIAYVKNKITFLECLCTCGAVKTVRRNDIVSGKTKSCGCLSREFGREQGHKNAYNLEGKIFGRLTVRVRKGSDGSNATWLCDCVCGGSIIVPTIRLTRGATSSCGCLVKEVSSARASSRVGPANPNWNSTLSEEDREKQGRPNSLITEWRNKVYTRDNYICVVCGAHSTGGTLNAHHLDSYQAHPEHRFDITNGVTLCTACHKAFHKQYGNKVNYEWQYHEFRNLYLINNLPLK